MGLMARATVALAILASAFGQATASVPKDQKAAFREQGAVTYFEFVQGNSSYAGSMNLFHSLFDERNNALYMCFATADHNIRNGRLSEVWYHAKGRPGFEIKVEGYTFKNATEIYGNGKIPDLAFVGLHVDLARHIDQVQEILKETKALKLGLAPTGDEAYNVKAYGYGISGSPDREYPEYMYVYHKRNRDEKEGIKRWYTNSAKNSNVKTSIYDFDGLTFDLTKDGGTRHEGMGLIGDSGGAIFGDDPETMIGIFTNFDKKYEIEAGYGFKAGMNGFGVRFTDAYKRGLETTCREYLDAVPEPGTLFGVGAAAAALAMRRMRKS